MRTPGLRSAWILACLLAPLAGCATPLFQSKQTAQDDAAQAEYESYLARKVSGQDAVPRTARAEQSLGDGQSLSAGAAAGGVVPATATAAGAGATAQPIGTSMANEDPKPKKEEDDGFDWASLDPANIYKNIKAGMGYGPNEKLANQCYQEGQALYQQRKYDEAAAKFATAADRWPDSTLEEDSLFFQGESYFFADRYNKACDTFLMLFKKYPNTRYLDTAASRQYAIGQYWLQVARAHPHWPLTPNFNDTSLPTFDTLGNAHLAFTTVRVNDPTGPLADDALFIEANDYFARGRYQEASEKYDELRREYPRSPHQVNAHLLDLQAKEQLYQGPYYDATPLRDADEVASQTLRQFPGKLGAEQARIIESKNEIREQRAQRELFAAQFYEKKQAYGSARIYYHDLIREFPDSRAAEAAQKRLEAIKNYPDNPPNYVKMLTSWLEVRK